MNAALRLYASEVGTSLASSLGRAGLVWVGEGGCGERGGGGGGGASVHAY